MIKLRVSKVLLSSLVFSAPVNAADEFGDSGAAWKRATALLALTAEFADGEVSCRVPNGRIDLDDEMLQLSAITTIERQGDGFVVTTLQGAELRGKRLLGLPTAATLGAAEVKIDFGKARRITLSTAAKVEVTEKDSDLVVTGKTGVRSPPRKPTEAAALSSAAEFQQLGRTPKLPTFLTTSVTLNRTKDGGVRTASNQPIRTRASDFLQGDFTFDLLLRFEREDKIAFIGIGPGEKDVSYNGLTNSIYLRFHPPWFGDGLLDVQNWRYGSTPMTNRVNHEGTHRVRIVKEGKAVTFFVDPDNDGPSDDDSEVTIPDIGEHSPYLNSKNSSLFFGGSGTFLGARLVRDAPKDDIAAARPDRLGSSRSLPDYLTTTARYQRTKDGGLRILAGGPIQSRERNYLSRDFQFEVVLRFERGDEIAFIGLGPGEPDRSFNGLTNSVYLRFHPPWLGDGLIDVQNWRHGSTPMGGAVKQQGTHLVRVTKQGDAVTFFVDPDNDGPSDDDLEMTIPNIKDHSHFLNSKNSNVFFGGSGTFLNARFVE